MIEEYESYYSVAYPTCIETFSTLRVFSDVLSPAEITKILQIEPTKAFCKGDAHSKGKLRRKPNGWFYSTEGLCDSRDGRRHIDTILSLIEGKGDLLDTVRNNGKIDIVSYWVSTGQGGPWQMPEQMLKLGALGIEIWWDVYFESGRV